MCILLEEAKMSEQVSLLFEIGLVSNDGYCRFNDMQCYYASQNALLFPDRQLRFLVEFKYCLCAPRVAMYTSDRRRMRDKAASRRGGVGWAARHLTQAESCCCGCSVVRMGAADIFFHGI